MTVLPRGIAKGAGQSNQQKSLQKDTADSDVGSIVQYDDDGGILLGIVLGTKKEKLLILNQRGREIELGRGRLYFLPGRNAAVAQGAASSRNSFLERLADKISQLVPTFLISEIWSFVEDEIKTYSVTELCNLYLGREELEQHAALRIALVQERVHFKRDKDGFEPRTRTVIEDLQRGELVKREKEAVRERTIAFFKHRAKDHSTEIPQEALGNIELLARIAANAPHLDHSQVKEGKELTQLAASAVGLHDSAHLDKTAFAVLEKIGYFHKNTNLSFIRHEIVVSHGESALSEGDQLPERSSITDYTSEQAKGREDLTRLRTFTIDDITTKDMDDALSVEQTIDGYEIGIHITDVASAILPQSALDIAARRRATSIYCADQTVHMLPPAVSESKLSLKPETIRPCLSCIVSIAPDFSIVKSQIKPSWICSSVRYSYDEVDSLLEAGDSTLLTLHEFAVACEDRRNRNGAMRVHKREVVPHVDKDGNVTLQEIDEDSPARALVAEMMVLANTLCAEFAAAHAIPILFRGQERPDDETPVGETPPPDGPAKDFSGRVKMKKSTVSLEPLPHAGLGVPAYTQMTSPIRRYMDLCHQRQVVSFIQTGQPWLDAQTFEKLAQEVELHLQAANVASRETRRFWLLRYLEQRKRGIPIGGTVVRLDLKAPLIELDEVYITLFARSAQRLQLGDRVSVTISAVDPQADFVRLEASIS